MLSICYTVDHVKHMVIPAGGEVGRGPLSEGVRHCGGVASHGFTGGYLTRDDRLSGRQAHTIGGLLLLPFGLTRFQ
jgi:hypothetical protein